MGGRTEDRGHVVGSCQLRDGVDAGLQIGQGEHLGLVEDHHAVGDIVELATGGGAVIVQRLKKLHRRGHHDRHIPVLGGVSHSFLFGVKAPLLGVIVHDTAMVLQYHVLPQDLSKHRSGLFDDRGIGDHVNDTVFSRRFGMAQGKSQRGDGLAAACGNGQGEKGACPCFPLRLAGVQDRATDAVELPFGRIPSASIGIQPLIHLIPLGRNVIPRLSHEGGGVQKVRVNEAGVEHTGMKEDLLVVPYSGIHRGERS